MTMNLDDIENFINNQDLDIRKKGNNPRFIDQKCTPDVLSFIADMAIHQGKQNFLPTDIWHNPEFVKLSSTIFGKPSPTNKTARNEYNKFIGQNLELLAYAGILEKITTKRPYSYTIIEKEVLEYIALRDRNAFLFLNIYFNKLLSDSNFMPFVDNFLSMQTKQSFNELKDQFVKFMQRNTQIGSRGSIGGGKTEIGRMFPKIINVLAVENYKRGSIKGRISPANMTYAELMYNRENFRDIGNKSKSITRQENRVSANNKATIQYNEYLISKAKNRVKSIHPQSEVNDNNRGKTDHIHHIFPKEEFLDIANYGENLIALTAGQHLSNAHPRGNTHKVDIEYQRVCLLAKSATIKNQLEKGDGFYSKESFIYVINVGFRWIDTDKALKSHATFEEIGDAITRYYRQI